LLAKDVLKIRRRQKERKNTNKNTKKEKKSNARREKRKENCVKEHKTIKSIATTKRIRRRNRG